MSEAGQSAVPPAPQRGTGFQPVSLEQNAQPVPVAGASRPCTGPGGTPGPRLVASLASAVGLTGTLSPADLALFAEMLAGLVRAKLPLPNALRLIGKEAENRGLRDALAAVEQDVAAGVPLPDALRKREGKFPHLFTLLLEQGCAANDLHAALVELVREYRSQAHFREQLWSQLMGPLVTTGFLGIIIVFLLVFNIPTVFGGIYYNVSGIYSIMGASLPLPTRIAMEIGRLLHDPYGLGCLLAAAVGLFLLFLKLRQSRRVRFWTQCLLLRLPIIGPYVRTAMVGRFCRLLSILLHRRVPLPAAMALVRDSVDFVPAQEAVTRLADHVAKGGALADALSECRFFPPTLAQFVRGAETHGELPQSLSRLADLYDERANLQGIQVRMMVYVIAQLTVGLLVLTLLLSVFLPIFKIQEMMRKK